MKKLVLTAVVTVCSIVLFAQQAPAIPNSQAPAVLNADPNHLPSSSVNTDKKNDMKDARHDIHDIRKDKSQRADDRKDGNKKAAEMMTKNIRNDKKDLKGDAKDLKNDGVKHPIRRAHRQIVHHHETK